MALAAPGGQKGQNRKTIFMQHEAYFLGGAGILTILCARDSPNRKGGSPWQDKLSLQSPNACKTAPEAPRKLESTHLIDRVDSFDWSSQLKRFFESSGYLGVLPEEIRNFLSKYIDKYAHGLHWVIWHCLPPLRLGYSKKLDCTRFVVGWG